MEQVIKELKEKEERRIKNQQEIAAAIKQILGTSEETSQNEKEELEEKNILVAGTGNQLKV